MSEKEIWEKKVFDILWFKKNTLDVYSDGIMTLSIPHNCMMIFIHTQWHYHGAPKEFKEYCVIAIVHVWKKHGKSGIM